ncbi:NAD-dependent epimerase [Proteiniclasticum ruminis]|uniref:UDP-glucuronate 4-epimerase n=1 Tax=Proteiniclasticum ruminis TaxID=398199 RepID=A0A1G8JNH9_9CLOT|nr:NAD-dependent epimerase [Proteiniclasticum ruminis]SDI32732.1 UDP-glucuronate 4-epimerase [Proteiniclasticum ruminis]
MKDVETLKILVTGGAGFIGYHLTKALLREGHRIIGIDNMNEYYDPQLKYDRISKLVEFDNYQFLKGDITNKDFLLTLFENSGFEIVINLAAQAGVRYSIENPYAYIDSNIYGFMNVLEACRHFPVKHLLYASSSSVYGGNKMSPFSTSHNVDHPVSLYAATKKSNELMAHTYSHLYGIPTTGLRFFTVYGPFGRPDMAYYSFTKDIFDERPIKVFNHGLMERDFTYIDDVVEGIIGLLKQIPSSVKNWDESKDSISSSFAPYKIYNIGNNAPVSLMRFIKAIESSIGKEAKKVFFDMQPGDVVKTYADVDELEEAIDFKPTTTIEDGISRFVNWYKDYYNIRFE